MKKIILITLLGASYSSVASDSTTLKQQLTHCSAIEINSKRLACYDAIIKPIAPAFEASSTSPQKTQPAVTVATPTPPVPTIAQRPVNTKEQKVAEFGAEKLKEKTEEIDKIRLTVSRVKKNVRGLKTFYFTNGQVWKEIETSRFKIKKDEQVHIKRGSLGSFKIGSDKNNRTARVKRIK